MSGPRYICQKKTKKPVYGGQHRLVVKAVSTNAYYPSSIPSVGRQDRLPDRIDFLDGYINRGSLYHCTLTESKRTLKVSKQIGLLDVQSKLY